MNKKFLVFSGVFLIIICSIYFVLAYATATDIVFSENASVNYDEGHFLINWTNTTTPDSPIGNWSVALWMNGNLANVIDNANTSGTNNSGGYTWTNITEANYTFAFSAFFDNGTRGDNSSNVSMYVDNTAPLLNWTGSDYVNGTFKKNTDTLTLNIFVADALSGIVNSGCIFNVSGTNQTVMGDSGWCNSTAIALTDLDDGNHTIDVYANDTVNNVGVNLSFYVVQIDTTAPVATLACSPSSVILGSVVTCECSGTDSGSGINNSLTSAATTPSTSSAGTFTATGCSVTDNAGNSDTATDTYSVTSPTGGATGTSTTSEASFQKTHTWSRINIGIPAVIEDFDEEIGLKQIQIQVNSEAQNVKMTISKYDSKPAEVSIEKSGKTYKYLQINTENLEEKLNKAIIRMQVEKSWMVANGLTDNVAMFKFNEVTNQWDELNTIPVGSDDDYSYYDFEVDSFSYFAISEKALVSDDGTTDGTGTTTDGVSDEGLKKWWCICLIVLAGLLVIYVIYAIYKNKKIT
ncbi:PGF-pre-PGF domain-containing protein [Candidatus Pacearchaeota archaeon]|nr:PGF-pre-PGF domain-containing protein [Candidatus Pacearchaeota archaeon]